MTSDRVYRQRLPIEQAWDEVHRNSGSQFDPALVELFEIVVDPERLGARLQSDSVAAAEHGDATAEASSPR
jgi:HD-GYP domain-containing protein (c-di-GMP phosphodiesterase class II)